MPNRKTIEQEFHQPFDTLSEHQMERAHKYASILLRSIKTNLGEVDFFTREDLLQLPVFDHITTISRYRYICLATHILITSNNIVEKSRTALCLPNRASRFSEVSLSQQYEATIQKLILRRPMRKSFSVMDVVDTWNSDPHLTVNNKRVAVRGMMPKMIHKGVIKKSAEFSYTLVGTVQ